MWSRWQWSIALPTDDEGSLSSSSSSRGKKGMYLRRYNTPRANPRLKLCLGPIDPFPYSKRRDSEARIQKFEWDKFLSSNKVLREKINNKNLMKEKKNLIVFDQIYIANLYFDIIIKINKDTVKNSWCIDKKVQNFIKSRSKGKLLVNDLFIMRTLEPLSNRTPYSTCLSFSRPNWHDFYKLPSGYGGLSLLLYSR